MKKKPITLIAIIVFALFFSGKPINHTLMKIQDDSIKYVTIQTIYLPNSVCNQGWATMVNQSAYNGGPNKRIRVYYTMNNRPMVCETTPLPPLPDPNQTNTLLGCVGGDYKITRSEYIQ